MQNKLKVIFICSGNKWDFVSPVIKNQGDSLEVTGINIQYYPIKGKGIIGYLKNIPALRRMLKSQEYDIVHAHYSFSAFVATLAGAKPLVVSLMGTEVKEAKASKLFIKLIAHIFWKAIILKSNDMKVSLRYRAALVIPNGVDLDNFKPMDRIECQQLIGWDKTKKHILFASSTSRREKNFALADAAISLLENVSFELHYLENIRHDQISNYLNAADVMLLTSKYEGSPNVIKEAMACNRPIVSTDVGDVKWVFGNTDGCFISLFDANDVARQIEKSLKFSDSIGVTKGRDRIISLGLDSKTVAKKVNRLYNNLLDN